MEYKELFSHANHWASHVMGYNAVVAGQYAKWYATNYPDGTKEHSCAHKIWRYQSTGKLSAMEREALSGHFQRASIALNELRNALAALPKVYQQVNQLDGKLGELRRGLAV